VGFALVAGKPPRIDFPFCVAGGAHGSRKSVSTAAGGRRRQRREPNTTLTVVAGLILPFVVFAGILAAVAIPAHQDYVKRAQQAGQRR